MFSPAEIRIKECDRIIASAAWRFRHAAEYDDLYQEGMIAVWKCPEEASTPYIIESVYNRMKDWTRFVKRLRHYQSVSYDEAMHDDV